MAIFLDILILAALALFVYQGAKRGFVLTLCSLAAVFVAFLGAHVLASAAAPVVARLLQPPLENAIQQVLEEQAQTLGSGIELPVDQALEALQEVGGVCAWAAAQLEDLPDVIPTDDLPDLIPTTASLTASVASTAAAKLAHGILLSVGFVVIMALWGILSHTLNLVTRLPVLHGLNRALGGVLGLGKGLVLVWLAAWILCDLTGVIPLDTVGETRLLHFLAAHGPTELLPPV